MRLSIRKQQKVQFQLGVFTLLESRTSGNEPPEEDVDLGPKRENNG